MAKNGNKSKTMTKAERKAQKAEKKKKVTPAEIAEDSRAAAEKGLTNLLQGSRKANQPSGGKTNAAAAPPPPRHSPAPQRPPPPPRPPVNPPDGDERENLGKLPDRYLPTDTPSQRAKKEELAVLFAALGTAGVDADIQEKISKLVVELAADLEGVREEQEEEYPGKCFDKPDGGPGRKPTAQRGGFPLKPSLGLASNPDLYNHLLASGKTAIVHCGFDVKFSWKKQSLESRTAAVVYMVSIYKHFLNAKNFRRNWPAEIIIQLR
ncbi:hypothetical protein NMY22_g17635 [Coprinellus aureogranulatus]|nr:hypothetical protein NMY22_g17635 [Coprinellus aureogranulatus]